jgi:hypothetical protein
MLKRTLFVAIASLFILTSASSDAEAKKYLFKTFWPESHWWGLDYEPYRYNAKNPQETQWSHGETKQKFDPAHWINTRGGISNLVRGFYQNDLIRDQYLDDDLLVLEVGPNFYNLSGYDKRRVLSIIDKEYGVTTRLTYGVFYLRDWKSDDDIGLYTRYGLQLH